MHGAALTVGEVRTALADDHVHMLLLVEGGRLLGTVVRGDVPEEAVRSEPALAFASMTSRTVGPAAPLDAVLATMLATGARRLDGMR